MHTAMLIVSLTIGATPADTWPGFRGDGTNHAMGTGFPLKWSSSENVAWKSKLPGYGQSSPVVHDGRVFITAVEGPMKEKCVVVAFDAQSGEQLWRHDFPSTQRVEQGWYVSRAAPTPLVDSDGVYAFWETGDLIKLSHDGKVHWQRSLAKEYGESKGAHGLGGSPTQTAEAVVILVADSEVSYLLAVDKKSGENLWKVDRAKKTSWTSPLVVERDGKTSVVVSGAGVVEGYDARTGKQMWSYDEVSGNTVPSAAWAGPGQVLVGASVDRRAPDEKGTSRSNCCLSFKDGTVETRWRASRATSSFSTPLAYAGAAYFVNQVGVVFCLDLESGEQHYSERLDDGCWASPLGAEGRVYFFGKSGKTTVLKAGETFEVLANNVLFEEDENPYQMGKAPEADGRERPGTFADPIVYGVAAIADSNGGAFYIRTGTMLYCVRGK